MGKTPSSNRLMLLFLGNSPKKKDNCPMDIEPVKFWGITRILGAADLRTRSASLESDLNNRLFFDHHEESPVVQERV
jgi:hypothetical protein